MKNNIGVKPVRYFSLAQLEQMSRYDLMEVVKENDWYELIGKNKKENDWKDLHRNLIEVMVHTKMNEYKQQMERKV